MKSTTVPYLSILTAHVPSAPIQHPDVLTRTDLTDVQARAPPPQSLSDLEIPIDATIEALGAALSWIA
jgi:hypothetical protein